MAQVLVPFRALDDGLERQDDGHALPDQRERHKLVRSTPLVLNSVHLCREVTVGVVIPCRDVDRRRDWWLEDLDVAHGVEKPATFVM